MLFKKIGINLNKQIRIYRERKNKERNTLAWGLVSRQDFQLVLEVVGLGVVLFLVFQRGKILRQKIIGCIIDRI
jgi:hypothetical protein